MTPEFGSSLPDIFQSRLAGVNFTYRSPHVIELTQNTLGFSEKQIHRNNVLVISGPPGGGKDTLVEALIAEYDIFTRFKTATTRPPRASEIPNSPYLHITTPEFEAIEQSNGFIETNRHQSDNGQKALYGSPRHELTRAWQENKIPIMRVDPNGGRNLRSMWDSNTEPFHETNFIYVYVSPPNQVQLRGRLLARDLMEGKSLSEAKQHVDARWQQVESDLDGVTGAHFVVINHDNRLWDTKNAVLHLMNQQNSPITVLA